MDKMTIKSEGDCAIMAEGGKKLGEVRNALAKMINVGVNALEVEEKACELIKKTGGQPSFKMVPGYEWATCVNVNDGVVHGIPKKEIVFAKNDIVSVDVGLYYKGFHTDTSVSKFLGKDSQKEKFLKIGRLAVANGIAQAQPGKRIVDISEAIEETLTDALLRPIKSLTGHGIGKKLHEEPYIPCFVARGAQNHSENVVPGMALAIEVMYTNGNGEIKTTDDGWTIRTKDAKIAALFEETILVTNNGPEVITA